MGNYIQHKGGVVTAEELAPYMDVPQAGKDPESLNSDESYVMPALVRFNGSAEVDKNNNIIYRFPTLQKTGRRQVGLPACSLHCLLHAAQSAESEVHLLKICMMAL